MSSRPATPTEDITNPQQQTESIRRTRSQTRQSQLQGSRHQMIATAHYQGHNPYLHPPHHHPLQDFTRHEQQSATVQSRDLFASPAFTFDTSYNTSAATTAPLAISSGGVEGRREAAEDVKSGSQKHGHASSFDDNARHRQSASLEESRRHGSTGTDTAVETPAPTTKKKRTRTLTTSNQSSVLLALLAKTPFPTTAEREEVGRAIGLTARKVQVWFQNQRQKQKKSGHMGSSTVVPQGATTSAPLPLSRQPGYSALHAARMGYHEQTSPPFPSSNIAPYPGGSGGRDQGEAGHYDPSSPPIGQVPPRGQAPESYQTNPAYNRPFSNDPLYYSLRPETGTENEQYPQTSMAPSSDPTFAHSTLSQPGYLTGDFPEPFNYRLPHSREPSSHSFAYPPPSQEPSVSDDQSRPTTSRGGQNYRPSSGGSWRSKPLPPLPQETGRPMTGQSLGWDQNSSEHGFRPPTLPSRSRAFSNPDPAAEGYGSIRPFAPMPSATSGLAPSTTFGSSRYYSGTTPAESVAPSAYHAPSEYHTEEAQRMRHAATGSMGDQYSFRYADQFPSPGGVSSSSSLSFSEAGLGLSASSQHPPSSVSYSPLEQRRARLSYDSSLAAGSQVLGKRSWSTDEGRVSKRARTDDGHATLPLRSSTRALPPANFPPRNNMPPHHGAQEIHHPTPANPLPPRSEDLNRPYNYEPPSSDPTSGV